MIQLLVVSDIRLFREGLHELLRRDGRLALRESASCIGEALDMTRVDAPDAVLLDMGIPEPLHSIRALREAAQSIKVVTLGISESSRDVVACAEAGAAGYVCRDSSVDDLVAAVTAAMREELVCSARISAALLHQVARLATRRAEEPPAVHLTRREVEVAEMLDGGLSNKEIAAALCIEVPTVKAHVHNILDKVGCHRRGQAAARLRRMGVLRVRGAWSEAS